MKNIIRKINSKRGASMLFALLFFLVASMVSIVILNAAVTMVKRVHDDNKEEQAYLAVSSAARFVGDCLGNTECTIVKKKEETTNNGIATITNENTEYTVSEGPLKGIILEALKASTKEKESDLPPVIYLHSEPIKVSSQSGNVEEILIKDFSMRPEKENSEDELGSYCITARFCLDAENMQLYLTALADVTSNSTESSEENSTIKTTTTTIEVKWKSVKLSPTSTVRGGQP